MSGSAVDLMLGLDRDLPNASVSSTRRHDTSFNLVSCKFRPDVACCGPLQSFGDMNPKP